jgi:hypothetical protein
MRVLLPFIGLAALSVVSAVVACSGGERANVGVTEPMVVTGAQFIAGAMPGAPPVEDGGAGDDGGAGATAPLSVVSVDYNNVHVVPGAAGKSFGGLATTDAVAVGVRLEDLGSGYWVVPVAGRDNQVPNTSDFSFSASFDVNDPPGERNLLMVAIDASGNAGTQLATELCLQSRIPDNGHACDLEAPVPAVVISLQWDDNFDVDLHVITPDGTDVNPKTNPLAVPIDSGVPPAGDPRIDRDSLGQCVPDGLRQEDLVFADYPATGPYDIYAAPFASCGQTTVRFVLTIYEAGSDGELHATFTQAGELLASSQTGGGSSGLFITEKQFN